MAGDAAAVRGDPQLAAAAATWPLLAEGGSVGDLWVASGAELGEALAARRTGDVVALRVGGRSDLRPRVDPLEPDVWVIPPGVLAAAAGALALRTGGALREALATSVLFAEGAPGIGGVDPDVLAAMTDALESTDGASAR
ncbi:MAG: hypothetical protein KC486_10925 [Myxococcales bacterium]|nr:hypothetical protein [Myxococcales bacterium]